MTLHGDELRLCDLKQNGNLERAQRRRDIRLWPSQASQPARAGQRCSLHRTDCAKNSEFDDGESPFVGYPVSLYSSAWPGTLPPCTRLPPRRRRRRRYSSLQTRAAVVQPRQRKIRCRASDARKKKAVLGSAKKAKLLDHAPALASQRPSFPWSCGHGLAMHAAGVHADETNRHCAFCLSGIVSLTFARFVGNLAARRRGVPAAAAQNRKKMHDARF